MAIIKSSTKSSSSSSANQVSSIGIVDIKNDYDIVNKKYEYTKSSSYIIDIGEFGFKYNEIYNNEIKLDISDRDNLKFNSKGYHYNIYSNVPDPGDIRRFFVAVDKKDDNIKYTINDLINPEMYLFFNYTYEFVVPISIYEQYGFDFFSKDKKIDIFLEKKVETKNDFLIIRIFITGKNSKIFYGNGESNNIINLVDLSEFSFSQDENKYNFIEYFSFNYKNDQWRAYFPQIINLDIGKKTDYNINYNKGLEVCYYLNSIEAPDLTISSKRLYQFINQNYSLYPIKFVKNYNDNNVFDYNRYGLKIIDNQKDNDPNVFMSVYGVVDPYEYYDPYDPYYYEKSYLDYFYYTFTSYSFMGNRITVNDNGISFSDALNYFKIYYKSLKQIDFNREGRFIYFNYGMENFGHYFIVNVNGLKDNNIKEVKSYDMLQFLNKNDDKEIFVRSPFIDSNQEFIINFNNSSIDNILRHKVIDSGLRDNFSKFTNRISNYSQSDSYEYSAYIDAIKRLVKDISSFYTNSYFSINYIGENTDINLIKMRYDFLISVPSVAKICFYSDSNETVNKITKEINVGAIVLFNEFDTGIEIKKFKYANYIKNSCEQYDLNIDIRDVFYYPLSEIENNEIINKINFYEFGNFNNIFNIRSKYDRLLIGPLAVKDNNYFKYSKDVIYLEDGHKNMVKGYYKNLLSKNNSGENICLFFDYSYASRAEIERVILFHKECGFSSICSYCVSNEIYDKLFDIKSICELFSMKYYIYINEYTNMANIKEPCQYYYVGSSNLEIMGNLNYKKLKSY